MKKVFCSGVIMLSLLSGCSSQENVEPPSSHNSTEELKTWTLSSQTSIQTPDNSAQMYGVVSEYIISSKVFRTGTTETHTWYVWVEENKKEDLIGKNVKLTGISEKNKNEEFPLAETEIQELTDKEMQFVPDSINVVKFDATITPNREGKLKINSYLEDNLLGTSVVPVQGQ